MEGTGDLVEYAGKTHQMENPPSDSKYISSDAVDFCSALIEMVLAILK